MELERGDVPNHGRGKHAPRDVTEGQGSGSYFLKSTEVEFTVPWCYWERVSLEALANVEDYHLSIALSAQCPIR